MINNKVESLWLLSHLSICIEIYPVFITLSAIEINRRRQTGELRVRSWAERWQCVRTRYTAAARASTAECGQCVHAVIWAGCCSCYETGWVSKLVTLETGDPARWAGACPQPPRWPSRWQRRSVWASSGLCTINRFVPTQFLGSVTPSDGEELWLLL